MLCGGKEEIGVINGEGEGRKGQKKKEVKDKEGLSEEDDEINREKYRNKGEVGRLRGVKG